MSRMLALAACWCAMQSCAAATLWTGPEINFTRENFVDWTLPGNQDRMTDAVWITRADVQGLFNANSEAGFSVAAGSPAGTRWAIGSLDDGLENLQFGTWLSAMGNNPPSRIGVPLVVHLVSDDIYLDLRMLSWQSNRENAGGGGFSYIRSSPVPVPPAAVNLLLALPWILRWRARLR
ncbi:MAG: hypothetical protein AB7Q97_14690 [Gammaproteobacteria bacterium]